jgi:hypothetical protein
MAQCSIHFLISMTTLIASCATADDDEIDTLETPVAATQFIRGDANGDGKVDISDAYVVLNSFNGAQPIPCMDAADANDDGVVDISDSVFTLNFLFNGKGFARL